ncbi:hypothetical protein EHV15_34645 [Paenibacillus oralis]|uniref:Uncharacterized protein n=1 Tax=Paenibacillus oralis TaxID=2490856 RepID=A0A3P3TCB6_9BACL|nr:hypothetical protein [Paenibacillus oralis]RRJ54738.1 hypothetical protein EHV15_34645 [Paenibacillus oralis]
MTGIRYLIRTKHTMRASEPQQSEYPLVLDRFRNPTLGELTNMLKVHGFDMVICDFSRLIFNPIEEFETEVIAIQVTGWTVDHSWKKENETRRAKWN